VASETPAYEPLHALPLHFGAELATFERPPHGWVADPRSIARALAGARAGHVFLTNPHNPSGALLDEAAVAAAAREAARCGGWLLSNETYMEYVPASRRVRAHRLAPNALSIGSLTKAYGLGALRVGWVVLSPALASERSRFEDALYLDYVDPPTPSLRLALRAFERLADIAAPLERIAGESRPEFVRWLAGHARLRGSVAEFGAIAFPEVAGVADTRALGRYLAAEHDVGVVPGEFFQKPGHLRLGFGLPVARLREALERLDRGLAAFTGGSR
jgi:aspartate/methionine/tyrosine aminotransferase